MNKLGADPKVKKTLLRNYERKVQPTSRKQGIRIVESSPEVTASSLRDTVLSEPTLCSTTVLANYLTDVKKSTPPPLTVEDLNVDRGELCAKMTRKLNFHFNDRIYRNLIELNANIEELKSRKDKRLPSQSNSSKKDLEPNIEDFCEDEKESDSPPKIPFTKPKYKHIKTVEAGQLHKLVASFEAL